MSEPPQPGVANAWKPSRYNLLIPLQHGAGAAYNRRTGACATFEAKDYATVSSCLTGNSTRISELGNTEDGIDLGSNLIAGGFLVDRDFDELKSIKARYQDTRRSTPFLLTILPTFSCNLDCTYCAVATKSGKMSSAVEERLVDFASQYVAENHVSSFQVDWFGGEPLLVPGALERLSRAFLDICGRYGIPYRAQMVTNGTLITSDLVQRLATWRVGQVQVTLDGGRAVHDARRRWKASRRSSFDEIVRGLDLLVGRSTVRLRVNLDRRNIAEADWLLDFFDKRGWLTSDSEFYPYLAVVTEFTEGCSWSAEDACDPDALLDLQLRWMEALHDRGVPVLMQGLYGFPEPRPYCCGAVGSNGFIVTPKGLLHRCGFDVDEDDRSIARLGAPFDEANKNRRFWGDYDPFVEPECAECSALPSCLGGCPRNRRDRRVRLLETVCAYYREYEPKVLAHHLRLRSKQLRR
jgi:uncharacterized protein